MNPSATPVTEETRTHVVETDQQGTSPATTKTTDTVETRPRADPSLVDIALATPGVTLLFRIGVVLLAGYLAGAFVQRVVMGTYGIKIGPLELAPITVAETGPRISIMRDFLTGAGFRPVGVNADLAERYGSVDDPRLVLVLLALDLQDRSRHLQRLTGVAIARAAVLVDFMEPLIKLGRAVVLECRDAEGEVLILIRSEGPALLSQLDSFLREYPSAGR